MSLSARRAWIEIDWAKSLFRYLDVALRKESVDRNKGPEELAQFWSSSLSARRAWIEIQWRRSVKLFRQSLSARRAWIEIVLS